MLHLCCFVEGPAGVGLPECPGMDDLFSLRV